MFTIGITGVHTEVRVAKVSVKVRYFDFKLRIGGIATYLYYSYGPYE